MIPKTRPDLKIRVSPMVEILRVKITLGTLCRITPCLLVRKYLDQYLVAFLDEKRMTFASVKW